MTTTKDLFAMGSVKEQPSGMPGLSTVRTQKESYDLSRYNVRVQRFCIDEGLDDLGMMESLLSRCLNPKDDTAWLLERKDNFAEGGVFISIVFYLEKKPE